MFFNVPPHVVVKETKMVRLIMDRSLITPQKGVLLWMANAKKKKHGLFKNSQQMMRGHPRKKGLNNNDYY